MLSARYEAVAATRPRIRRDVLFTETPDGVLFHNADGGFRLTARSAYRFATLLVPHLDGAHTVAEICAGFGDRQRAMVGELVGTLYERGFARDVPSRPVTGPDPAADSLPSAATARRFAAQIAYVDHYADDPARRFQRFRETRVAVAGTDPVAEWCVRSLIRNGAAFVGVLPGLDRSAVDAEAAAAAADGCPVDVHELTAGLDGYAMVVVTGPDAPRAILPMLKAGLPAGRTVLPSWSYGRRAVVGPAMSERSTGCWACAALRLGAGDRAADAAGLWRSLALDLPADGDRPTGPLAAMLGNLLGYEVFKTATGALPPETAGQLIVQDMESLDVTAEPLLPHPRCPFCAESAEDAGGLGDALPEVDLAGATGTEALAPPTVDTARDADALVAELNRRSVLLRPHAGVFRRYDDEDITQTPLKLSVVELGLGDGRTRRVAAADVHHVAGARLRALHRAAEVYAEHVVPPVPAAASGPAVRLAPAVLGTASGLGGPRAEVTGWVAAVSLLTKERFLVPGAAVRPFGAGNGDRLFEATSAGLRAGPSAADATGQGLLSALAYDALTRALRTGGVPGVAVPADDPELTFLVQSAANLEVEAELLDFGERERSGVSVVLARSGARWAVGAELSYRAAVAGALRELLGQVQAAAQGLTGEGPGDDDTAWGRTDGVPYGEPRSGDLSFGDPLLGDLDPRVLTVTGIATGVPGPAASWAEVLRRLGERGRDAVVVPAGSADLAAAGVQVVRVLLTAEARRDG
ncbi:TOMM precursor leader peptide-binding protein [Streptomyces sp. NPDC048290]|uniref:TOMM precursor leader peptide-binding protein n=1 Tax=Streptomyces sp. NPDC048290 TaxID=3155811 RepID=UPI0034209EF9